MKAAEEKALADIKEYGCHVMLVFEDLSGPPFAYSVGIQKTTGAPEVIVIGLEQSLSHSVINTYNRRVREGERFTAGARYDGFLDGFQMQFEIVATEHFANHLGWNIWLYGGNDFQVLQMIYPTTDGVWPWDAAASDWFRTRQPVLAGGL